jgi:hypothetical protein
MRRLTRAWSVFAGRFLGIRAGAGRARVGTLHPADSTLAALACAWLSVTAGMALLVVISSPGYPVPDWLFGVAGAVALLWAPTLRATALTLREWPQLLVLAIGVGAPIWVIPMPERAGITALERLGFWALATTVTALAVPLLAFAIRVLRTRPDKPPEMTPL